MSKILIIFMAAVLTAICLNVAEGWRGGWGGGWRRRWGGGWGRGGWGGGGWNGGDGDDGWGSNGCGVIGRLQDKLQELNCSSNNDTEATTCNQLFTSFSLLIAVEPPGPTNSTGQQVRKKRHWGRWGHQWGNQWGMSIRNLTREETLAHMCMCVIKFQDIRDRCCNTIHNICGRLNSTSSDPAATGP